MGCGQGAHVKFLASMYPALFTGVEHHEQRADQARDNLGRMPGADVVHADVLGYLRDEHTRHYDVMYSRLGAMWFTDPELLLPAVHSKLKPLGRLVFSVGLPGFREFTVPRWDLSVQEWRDLLPEYGFTHIEDHVLICPSDCPDAKEPGLMVMKATKA